MGDIPLLAGGLDRVTKDPEEPQLVIMLATFTPTGGDGKPVPRFREPMIMPEVRNILLELGWREPEQGDGHDNS